jgi:S-methylmethionine-dependent homocysteine/selenocysteine methylase
MCPSRCFWTLVLPILAAAEVAEDQQVVEFKQQITAWHAEKAALGATFAGSPAWTAHLQFIERELAQRGVAELQRREVRYQRWFAPATGDGAIALRIGAEAVPVASYWAYSGNTGPAGVSAPMIYYDEHLAPESLAGRIVVFDVSALPERMKTSFQAKAEFFTPPASRRTSGTRATM